MTRLEFLAPSLATADGCRSVVAKSASQGGVEGVVVERGGRPVAFVLGNRLLLPPTDLDAQFVPPYTASVGVESFALAEGEDAVSVLRCAYAALAERWVRDGFFVHRWVIPAGDPGLTGALVELGFGKQFTAATRPTADPVAGATAKVEVHRAGSEDDEVVMRLSEDLNQHHLVAPIFWPIVRTAEPAVRRFTAAALQGDIPFFIAYKPGGAAALGMQSFLRPGYTPPIVDHENDVYLFEGVVTPDAQSGGVGSALLSHSMAWASTAGYRSCTLHFAPQNPSGAPFWLGHGFVPVEYTMQRMIDQRVAWAR